MILHIPSSVSPCQVEIPKDSARSRSGAIHVRAGSLADLTDDEVTAVRKAIPSAFVVDAQPASVPLADDAEAPSPAPETPALADDKPSAKKKP